MERTKIKGETMNYFKNNNNELFAYDDEQVKQGYGKDMIGISFEEVQDIQKAKEDEYKNSLEYKLSEAKTYLSSTDFKMTVDYFATFTPEKQEELTRLRAEAREFIRANEDVI